jgi:hypothetical protein
MSKSLVHYFTLHSQSPQKGVRKITTLFNPLPLPFKALLHGQKDRVFFSGHLTLSARPPFQNFSTPCILNVNNTGAKGSIMK